jgi:hypothetical protein
MFAALADPAGGIVHRPGALERVLLLSDDWQHAKDRLAGIAADDRRAG